MFTSGSTGVPKGVMLTHKNIQSNVQGLKEIFNLQKDDVIVGVLPFFHSFGYTVTIWFPLLNGNTIAYHKSPLEPVAIEKLISKQKGTILMGTPTFLQMWSKKFNKEKISSLKFVMVGAEILGEGLKNIISIKKSIISQTKLNDIFLLIFANHFTAIIP